MYAAHGGARRGRGALDPLEHVAVNQKVPASSVEDSGRVHSAQKSGK